MDQKNEDRIEFQLTIAEGAVITARLKHLADGRLKQIDLAMRALFDARMLILERMGPTNDNG